MNDGRRESGGKWSPGAMRFRAVMDATKKPNENATQWAYRMGLGPTQVTNFRNGIPISKMAANRIADLTGITTDFLMRGDHRFLTVDMRQRIEEALAVLEEKRKATGQAELDASGQSERISAALPGKR